LMVMVSVPLTVLSCESCTCMGKLKVPALVGVPVRTLLKSGAVVPRVRPGGSSLMVLTTDQVYGDAPPWAGRSWLYLTPTVPAGSAQAGRSLTHPEWMQYVPAGPAFRTLCP
jgi:hypothetical protein